MHCQPRSLVALLAVAIVLPALAFSQRAPRRPPEPFPVAVVEGSAADDAMAERLREAAEVVRDRVGDRDRWFRIVDATDDARIVLRLADYRVAETMTPKVQRQILDGAPILVEGSVVVETHSLNAVVVIRGEAAALVGLDERERGASLRNAASDLAEELEQYCKDNYQLLAEPS